MGSPVEQLPSPHLLDLCAKAWDLSHITFVRKMENIVYACDSPSGKVYLRFTTPLRRVRPEIEAEIHWVEHLAKAGIKVPHIIPDKQGRKVVSFTEEKSHFEAVVFSALSGEHPSEKIATDPRFLKTLGALIAQMHLLSQQYTPGGKREEWFEERGLRHALEAAAHGSLLSDRIKQTVQWLKTLPRTSETYGLVHADLGSLNLFIEEDSSIGIIDFDDSCYHWFVFDLAIVIFSMAGRFDHKTHDPQEEKWLADLLEGYQTVRLLSPEQIALIPKFIDFAFLRLYFWLQYHESLDTFHDDALEKVARMKSWALDRLSCG